MNFATRDQMIGRTLEDRYRVRSFIARGGMGTVYLADDLRMGRKVAIKMMHPHLVDDASFVRRFEKEAHAASRLSHPNLVNVYDQGIDGVVPYLVMEYVPHITLRQLLKQQKRLAANQAIEISEAVLQALGAAHKAGFIHRDVKPENVFLADDGRIKLGDFGLARSASTNTTTGQALLGTIAYLSPELITRGIADARSDIYAFGIMLYEMLTGVQPYRGEQAVQIAYKHANEDVPKPSLISSEATPELDELVRWTTLRDPDKRPKDANIVLARMQQLLGTGLNAATRQLGDEMPTTAQPTVQVTKVVGETEKERIDRLKALPPSSPRLPETPMSKLQDAAEKRAKRGRITALVVFIMVLILAFGGWWFGTGPGGKHTFPTVHGLTTKQAEKMLTSLGFPVTITSCSSPVVNKGLVVSTTPAEGTKVQSGSPITICESTGPKNIPVPSLKNVAELDAANIIADAGFKYDGVQARAYSADVPKGKIINGVDSAGNTLNDSLLEMSKIQIIVSAGAIPRVDGLPQDDAITRLTSVGLKIDPDIVEESSDKAAKGTVLHTSNTQALKPGDTVKLFVSKGPEMIKVPNVLGKSTREALGILAEAGLNGQTDVPEVLRGAVQVNDMDPKPGTEVRRGATIKIRYKL